MIDYKWFAANMLDYMIVDDSTLVVALTNDSTMGCFGYNSYGTFIAGIRKKYETL